MCEGDEAGWELGRSLYHNHSHTYSIGLKLTSQINFSYSLFTKLIVATVSVPHATLSNMDETVHNISVNSSHICSYKAIHFASILMAQPCVLAGGH